MDGGDSCLQRRTALSGLGAAGIALDVGYSVATVDALDLLGASSSASAERYHVSVQAGIIAAFGLVGLRVGFANQELRLGLSEFATGSDGGRFGRLRPGVGNRTG